MVGSRVVGSNVVVAMHNYRGCACNVGHGNGNAQPSWMVGSKEVVVIHTHRGCTVMFIANHGLAWLIVVTLAMLAMSTMIAIC